MALLDFNKENLSKVVTRRFSGVYGFGFEFSNNELILHQCGTVLSSGVATDWKSAEAVMAPACKELGVSYHVLRSSE